MSKHLSLKSVTKDDTEMSSETNIGSESQIPEVPVIIEQIESSDNITFKITDANAEATIIEVPNTPQVQKDNALVVQRNDDVRGDAPIPAKSNDDAVMEDADCQKSSLLDQKSHTNERANDECTVNDTVESQLKTDDASHAHDLRDEQTDDVKSSQTPKTKGSKRKNVPKIDTTVVELPQKTDDNLQSPETRLTRSRYGRVQKTKTPDPEMVSFNFTGRRRSSLKTTPINDEHANEGKKIDKIDNSDDTESRADVTPVKESNKIKRQKDSNETDKKGRVLRKRTLSSPLASPTKESGKKKKTSKLESLIDQIKAKSPNEMDDSTKIMTSDGSVKKKQTLKDYVPQKKSIELPIYDDTSIDRELLTLIPPQEGDYRVGDLIWAKLHGYPWWPCMVTIDPIEGKYSKISGVSYKAGHIYHVQYFGPHALRSWTNLGMMMPFEGKQKYLDRAKGSQIGSPKSRSAKIATKYAIKPNYKRQWDMSVEEAEEALKFDNETRLKKYTFEYIMPTKTAPKRKADMTNAGPNSKGAKTSGSPEDVYDFDDEFDDSQNGVHSTPILWRKRVVQKGDFNVYCKKHISKVKSENPKLNNDELNDIMKRRWELLSEDLRAQYVDRQSTGSSGVRSNERADKVESTHTGKKAKKSKTPKKVLQTPEVIVQNDDSDSEGQLVIAESAPAKKKTPKKSLKGKKSVNSEDSYSEKDNSKSADVIPEPSKASIETKTPKLKVKASIVKNMNEPKKPLNLPKLEPNTEVQNSERMPLQISDYFDELTSSEETSSTSETEVTDNKLIYEPFCTICHDEDVKALIPCQGSCFQMYHKKCVNREIDESSFKCDECSSGKHKCFVCQKLLENEETHKCNDSKCGKFYHLTCLNKNYPVKFNNEEKDKDNFICPLHFCLNCHIESDGKKNFRPSRRRLVKCISCPTAYHLGDYCIAAGTVTVSQNYVVCPDHFISSNKKKKDKHINVNWCFSCLSGGNLICCESCPASFHPKCLEYPFDPESNFYCRDCTLRKPLHYGDIVWVKLGFYRWWPGRVSHPKTVPDNVMKLAHGVGEFPVYFFGSHDYYWVHKGRAFLFDEGDNKAPANSGGAKTSKSLLRTFKAAMEEAASEFEEWQSSKKLLRAAMVENKPPPYVHIRSNKPVGQKEKVQNAKSDQHQSNVCLCDPENESPCSNETCLNRSLMTECDPKLCKAGERCRNQRFKKREYVQCKPFKTPAAGWGLRTLTDIAKGQFVIEYVGELIDERECERRLTQMGDNSDTKFYFLTIDKDNIIDAGPKGNLARFMNHSCQPNCETQKWMVNGATRVGLFAICDIPTDSELTFNYNLDCRGNEKTVCVCGAPNCSGFIGVRPIKSDDAQLKNTNGSVKKKKEKKKQGKQHFEKMHDDECFTCGEGGDLVMCDRKGCPKSFHLECLRLDKIPNGKWECPCHFCDVCGKPAKSMCSMCPNSLCKDHFALPGKMTQLPDGGLLCSDHANEDVNGLLVAPEVTIANEIEKETDATKSSHENGVSKSEEPTADVKVDSDTDKMEIEKPEDPEMSSDAEVTKDETSVSKDM